MKLLLTSFLLFSLLHSSKVPFEVITTPIFSASALYCALQEENYFIENSISFQPFCEDVDKLKQMADAKELKSLEARHVYLEHARALEKRRKRLDSTMKRELEYFLTVHYYEVFYKIRRANYKPLMRSEAYKTFLQRPDKMQGIAATQLPFNMQNQRTMRRIYALYKEKALTEQSRCSSAQTAFLLWMVKVIESHDACMYQNYLAQAKAYDAMAKESCNETTYALWHQRFVHFLSQQAEPLGDCK